MISSLLRVGTRRLRWRSCKVQGFQSLPDWKVKVSNGLSRRLLVKVVGLRG